MAGLCFFFFFSSRRRHTRYWRDWSSDVCSSDLGVTVLDYYGLTESYPLVANYPFMDVREGSMGRPMPGWDVRLLDEDEHEVPQGERGEICLRARRSEEHTSELQSRQYLVCRLLLEKKQKYNYHPSY